MEYSPEWMADAACVGMNTDIFFPEVGMSLEPARSVCRVCRVSSDCLAYGASIRWGIWGGMSYAERKSLNRRPSAFAPRG